MDKDANLSQLSHLATGWTRYTLLTVAGINKDANMWTWRVLLTVAVMNKDANLSQPSHLASGWTRYAFLTVVGINEDANLSQLSHLAS